MIIGVLLGSILFCNAAQAKPYTRVVPAEEWTLEAHTWLSRAVTAEVGWNNKWKRQHEQILVAFILETRYRIRRYKDSTETFVNTVRTYCTGMESNRKWLTRRQKWLRRLQPPNMFFTSGKERVQYPIEKPRHWNNKASWRKHQKYWGRTWVAMGRWAKGYYKHPCPGAKHWGGSMDKPSGNMYQLRCSSRFRNTIYGVR